MRTTPIHALLIDEDEAAELLGLAPRTLQTWRHRGEGPPYVRISSRCIRYRLADLEEWAAGLVRRHRDDPGEAA